MNGLCPACRRPYDDKDIEYKIITAEETAAHKARQAQKQKKTQQALQKEKQKAEADHLSRKHLAGLRVVQKNLVYVTGLTPTTQEDQLLQTLRGEQYFGQYGKIIKIVVSKAKGPHDSNSVGVYITYEKKEDAEMCIKAVDGSQNGDRTLRAQFGTTKYCSAYLRGENCANRNCMFLHEPGEANDSYSRADLSALNAGNSQTGQSRPQSQQPVTSASQPAARQASDQAPGPKLARPALPTHASWAAKPPTSTLETARSTSANAQNAAPGQAAATDTRRPDASQQQLSETRSQAAPHRKHPIPQRSVFVGLVRNFDLSGFKFFFSIATLAPEDREAILLYPPLFDHTGGARRRLRKQREEEQKRLQAEDDTFQQPNAVEPDEQLEMSGSFQLGGEPEERQPLPQSQTVIQPPPQDGSQDQRFQFGALGQSGRGFVPRQHQQQPLQPGKEGQGYLNPSSSSLSQFSNPPGHLRNASRYSFANESPGPSAINVKPVANAKLLNQQSSMMPQANNFGVPQQQTPQFFTSTVQGPPPGLKTSGTPPVSGGMTFGQGHGFATGGLQYNNSARSSANAANEDLIRNLMRTSQQDPSGKLQREFASHSFATNHPSSSTGSSVVYEEKRGGSGGKKKHKNKHRHGTASSSSGMGAGMNEDAIASMSTIPGLQSRFQHGYNAAVHGGFGGGRW